MTALIALLVCLIPTTIGGLLSAIGVAGMSRMMQANVIATSGRAVEAAGDVDVLLLDKTGTITHGNRQASAFLPAPGVTAAQLARAHCASLADETPEGRSIVVLAKQKFGCANAPVQSRPVGPVHRADAHERRRRRRWPRSGRRAACASCARAPATRSASMSNPTAAASRLTCSGRHGPTTAGACAAARRWSRRRPPRVLGVVELKDIVKGGIKERFAELRRMGIKTVMITGDNPLTAAAIAPKPVSTTSWPRPRPRTS
jgi:K+-transporting ATPase ATPase B chain